MQGGCNRDGDELSARRPGDVRDIRAGEGFVHVEFTVNGETVQSESRSRYPKADGYQYIAAGKIESIFPVYGEVGGGAVIDIRGEDLKPSYRCRVGDRDGRSFHFEHTGQMRGSRAL